MKRLRTLALALAGTLLGIVLLEWTVRAIAPFGIAELRDLRRIRAASQRIAPDGAGEPAWVWLPEREVVLDGGRCTVRTGPHGRRIPDRAAPAGAAPHGEIVFLGDGATVGLGVADAQTFVRRVERAWRERDPGAVACANAAHPAFRLVDAPLLCERLLFAWRPRALVVCGPLLEHVEDDLAREALCGEPVRPLPERLLPSLSDLVQRLRSGPHTPDPEAAARRREAAETALGALAAACRARGVPLVVVDLGTPWLADACRRHGVPVIAAAPPGAERRAPVFLEGHPARLNALGHERIAERLLVELPALLP